MKVLIIENNLVGGGAEKVLLTLLHSLPPSLFDITLLLIKNKGVYLNDVPSYIKKQCMIDITADNSAFPTDADILSRFCKKNIGDNYDVEIAFLEGPPTKLLSFSSNSHSKKIAWVHIDLEKVHWTYSYFSSLEEERNCYLKMDQIVFVSENAKRGFEKLFQMSFPGSCVINNPIDSLKIKEMANEYPVDLINFSCVIVGSLVNRKGHSRLFYAMERLIQMGYRFHLYVVGEGAEESSLKELCQILNISEYVDFIGFKKNPYPYIANSQLLISSSISEGYPLVLCEALSLGVPIMATDCTGNRDVLQNGKYGMLVNNTEEGIFNGLQNILSSQNTYCELLNKAKLGLEECQFETRIEQIKKLIMGETLNV